MKIHEVAKLLDRSGEYIFGADQTGSHACYLIYGKMEPREHQRALKAGKGHEEIFLAIQGDFIVTKQGEASAASPVHVKEGQAFHLVGDDAFFVENKTDSPAIYVMAGGHSEHGHH